MDVSEDKFSESTDDGPRDIPEVEGFIRELQGLGESREDFRGALMKYLDSCQDNKVREIILKALGEEQ